MLLQIFRQEKALLIEHIFLRSPEDGVKPSNGGFKKFIGTRSANWNFEPLLAA